MSFFADAPHWAPEPAELVVGVVGDNAVAVRYELAVASYHHVVVVVVSFVVVGDTEPASTVVAANLFAAVVDSTKVVVAAVAESYNEMVAELVV